MQIIVVNGYINTKSIMYSCTLVVFSIITYIAAKKKPYCTSNKFSLCLKAIYYSSVLIFIQQEDIQCRQASNKIIAKTHQRYDFHNDFHFESYQSLLSDSQKICFQVPVPNSSSQAILLLSLCKDKIYSSRVYFLLASKLKLVGESGSLSC